MDTTAMEIDTPTQSSTPSQQTQKQKQIRAHDLQTTTIKTPPFAYAHLKAQYHPPPTKSNPPILDALQVRSYLTSALRQFLGDTGAGVAVDILQVSSGEGEGWVRVPRGDLGAFAGAVTAFAGMPLRDDGGTVMVLRLGACGDWLGSLLGRGEEERRLWGA
ncbi:hypothetical protein B0T22DRAFT_467075 [Podospora appendiculata]|uniref:Ribonucleases P/MRP subunit Pop8-like domain-containing protein n=1 Tax=Podospora appendiculata TaxID=314037 RepID=A0AAE1CAZ0_9PEZI|nr:hypothetical protein B0T22DRAFT_467075 [Podospora appendiculata]